MKNKNSSTNSNSMEIIPEKSTEIENTQKIIILLIKSDQMIQTHLLSYFYNKR